LGEISGHPRYPMVKIPFAKSLCSTETRDTVVKPSEVDEASSWCQTYGHVDLGNNK
jgi:hypothetical protein